MGIYLHIHGPSLYLGDALGEDEGDAVVGTASHLAELPAEELQAALQLLVAALDGQRLQAAFVTRQETLRGEEEAPGVQTGQRVLGGGGVGAGVALPPHTPPPGSTRSCHTRGTWKASAAS